MWSIINDSFPQINKLIKIPLHVVWKCTISEKSKENCMKDLCILHDSEDWQKNKQVLLYANNKSTNAVLTFILKCWLSICWQTGCDIVHELTIRDLCFTLKCDLASKNLAIKIFSHTSTTATTKKDNYNIHHANKQPAHTTTILQHTETTPRTTIPYRDNTHNNIQKQDNTHNNTTYRDNKHNTTTTNRQQTKNYTTIMTTHNNNSNTTTYRDKTQKQQYNKWRQHYNKKRQHIQQFNNTHNNAWTYRDNTHNTIQ